MTANEIEYNTDEVLFLKQILFKLQFHLNLNEYRKFLIRFFALIGSKEVNSDFLHFALDLCLPNSEYLKVFLLNADTYKIEPAECPIEVLSTNNILINTEYINTLIDVQNTSIEKLSTDQNYLEIIRLFFTKSETDLPNEEKSQLCNAIIKAELWQKGIDFFENWSNFNEECLRTILCCVTDKKAQLTFKLAKKIAKLAVEGNSIFPWLILYWTLMSEDNTDTNSLMKFFTMGHNILGKRGICTDFEGEFLLNALKFFIKNDYEHDALLCSSCLFNFPPRKNYQSQDFHTAAPIELKWSHCVDIYEYFVPEEMPEFDSLARQSGITQETKEFLIKILNIIPDEEKPKNTIMITNYIKTNDCPLKPENKEINIITSTIYYFLADYHFKAKDFAKAKYFYINDLSLNVNRFDSWAGLALTINYQLDQMLIEGKNANEKFHQMAFSTMQCFRRSLELQPDNYKIWIEYGILCYNVASNCSRLMKEISSKNEESSLPNSKFKFEEVLALAKNCFERVNEIDVFNEETWLSYYMLGKISEKLKHDLLTILEYYQQAYLCIYLDKASYPRKITYYNPPYLSIEALEIHYRIHSVILKYLLNNKKFSARMLRHLKFFLINVNKSPFVLRKVYGKKPNGSKQNELNSEEEQQILDLMNDMLLLVAERELKFDVNRARNELISMCIRSIKMCLSRYNAHYKSYFRLAHYYYTIEDYNTAKAILCGGTQNKQNPLLRFEEDSNKPNSNPGYISGLFMERKSNNLYSGIWRIPADDIDRPGNFNFHMFRCTDLLINVCYLTDDYNLLSLISIQLNKTPEPDKKYLNNDERIMLSKKAFDKCFQVFSRILTSNPLNPEQIIEMQSIAQNMLKNDVFIVELQQNCNYLNELLTSRHRLT